jgi:hypothetical protein
MRVVGSGLGRTGTHSLKVALEQLLGEPCYHMVEVFAHPDHVAVWHAAARGEAVDWRALLDGYEAVVDWPAAAFWSELAEVYPDAIILHSERADAEAWWTSATKTIFEHLRRPADPGDPWRAMVDDLFADRFGAAQDDPAMAIAAYERHNADVRASADPARLVIWRPGDGWEPLCEALGVPVPDEPFPVTNTTAEFRAMAGLDQES